MRYRPPYSTHILPSLIFCGALVVLTTPAFACGGGGGGGGGDSGGDGGGSDSSGTASSSDPPHPPVGFVEDPFAGGGAGATQGTPIGAPTTDVVANVMGIPAIQDEGVGTPPGAEQKISNMVDIINALPNKNVNPPLQKILEKIRLQINQQIQAPPGQQAAPAKNVQGPVAGQGAGQRTGDDSGAASAAQQSGQTTSSETQDKSMKGLKGAPTGLGVAAPRSPSQQGVPVSKPTAFGVRKNNNNRISVTLASELFRKKVFPNLATPPEEK